MRLFNMLIIHKPQNIRYILSDATHSTVYPVKRGIRIFPRSGKNKQKQILYFLARINLNVEAMNYSDDKEKLTIRCTSFSNYKLFYVGANLHYLSASANL